MKEQNNGVQLLHKESKIRILHGLFSIFFICSIIFSIADTAKANEYYVATWGNNLDNGLTNKTPWQNISYAAKQVVAGDTIYVMNGTWYKETADFYHSGNSTHPITVTAYDGTVIFDGYDRNSQNIFGKIVDKNYINISKIIVRNYSYPFSIRNSNNIHISNIEVYWTSTWSSGVLFTDSTYSSLKNSTIHDTGWTSVGIISYATGSHHIIIQNNTIRDNPGNSGYSGHGFMDLDNGMSVNNASLAISDIDIIDNTMFGNSCCESIFPHSSGGIRTIPMYRINISNNIIHDAKTILIAYFRDSIIANNILYNITDVGIRAHSVPTKNVIIKDNIFSNISYSHIRLLTEPNSQIIIDNNNASSYVIENGDGLIKDVIPSSFTIQTMFGSIITIKFTNGKVMLENGVNTTLYYPDRSEYVTSGDEIVTINSYPMTAHPTTNPATVTVNKFDTSLSQGNILVDFTANTTNSNNVNFTVGELKQNRYYNIKRDGSLITTKQADATGYIQFSNSEWSQKPRTFTIIESSVLPSTGNASGAVADTSGSPIAGASVTDGTVTTTSNSSGYFFLSNILTGSRNITVSKTGYQSATASITVVENSIVTVDFKLKATYDNRLREGSPDTVYNTSSFMDIGQIPGTSKYRDVIWFNLSAYNTSNRITGSILSLFWYYPENSRRNQSTTVEIYRPLSWDPDSVNWKNRSYGTPWTISGGDWFDRNNAAYGSVPFASITFNASTLPDNRYYNFNVTDLVQNYVSGKYPNTGFFIKAKDEYDNYIAFYSSDHTNASQRPKLVINYTTGGTPSNLSPSITSFSPNNPTPSYVLNSTTPFSVITDQAVTITWYLNGTNQNNNAQAWSHTWDTVGQYNVTYVGSNGNGSVSIMWNVSVAAFSPLDVDRNGVINKADLDIIRSNFGKITYAPYPSYDVTGYGIVDVYDITVVSTNISE